MDTPQQGQNYWLLTGDNLDHPTKRKYILFKGALFYNFLEFIEGEFQSQKGITTCTAFKETFFAAAQSISNKNRSEEQGQSKEKSTQEATQKIISDLRKTGITFSHGCGMCNDFPDKCYMLVCYGETEPDGNVYAPAIAISITYSTNIHIQYHIGITRLDILPLQSSRLLPHSFSVPFFKKACWAIIEAEIGNPVSVVVNPNTTMKPGIDKILEETSTGRRYLTEKGVIDLGINESLGNYYRKEINPIYTQLQGLFDIGYQGLGVIANNWLFVIPITEVDNPSGNEGKEGGKEGGRRRMKRKTKRKRRKKKKKKKKTKRRRKRKKKTRRHR
jgi:hypothetical protein